VLELSTSLPLKHEHLPFAVLFYKIVQLTIVPSDESITVLVLELAIDIFLKNT